MKKKLVYLASALGFPFLAAAQSSQPVTSLQSLIGFLITFINTLLVPFVFAVAFIVFIFGVFQYFILGAGDEEKRNNGRVMMIYGIVGFFVMVSVWGLVNIATGTLNLNKSVPDQPQAPYPAGQGLDAGYQQ